MISQGVDSRRTSGRICHLQHQRVVLLSDLPQEEECIQVCSHFVEIRRVEDRLDAVQVKVIKI